MLTQTAPECYGVARFTKIMPSVTWCFEQVEGYEGPNWWGGKA
jgi:hypothetical protein